MTLYLTDSVWRIMVDKEKFAAINADLKDTIPHLIQKLVPEEFQSTHPNADTKSVSDPVSLTSAMASSIHTFEKCSLKGVMTFHQLLGKETGGPSLDSLMKEHQESPNQEVQEAKTNEPSIPIPPSPRAPTNDANDEIAELKPPSPTKNKPTPMDTDPPRPKRSYAAIASSPPL